MAEDQILSAPKMGEYAESSEDKDPGKSWVNNLLVPEDKILMQKGGGDYAIYRELLRDDQVKSVYQQRRLALVSKELEVHPGAENDSRAQQAADMLKENLLEQLQWDNIADGMHYGIFYGFAVGECLWENDGGNIWLSDIKVRKRERFRWGKDSRLYLLTANNYRGEKMPDNKFWTFSSGSDNNDDPYGLGLAHSLYWPTFFKRQDIRFWLKFLEKYASPTITGKAAPGKVQDPSEKKKILNSLQALVNDSAVVIPDDLEIGLLEASRSGTIDYDQMRDTMDRAIAKIIVGQTMTSEQDGGQYKADVAKDVRDELVKADADLIANSFNQGPARWLTYWNFGPDVAPPRIWWKTEQEEDLKERAERDNKIFSLGYEPTEEYIEETYGPGWQKKAAPTPLRLPQSDSGDFAEAMAILDALSGHRGDQRAIKRQAQLAGLQFREIFGDRVDELLSYLEETGDLVTFRKRLAELAEDQPAPETVEKLQRQGFFSRLLGNFRMER